MNSGDRLWILVLIELGIILAIILVRVLFKLWDAHKINKAMKFLAHNIERKADIEDKIYEYRQMDREESNNDK